MILRFVLGAMLIASATVSVAAPPPPPAPEEEGQMRNFVKALPRRIPHDLESFAPFVAADVNVYRDGKLAFTDRSGWFAFLRGFAGRTPEDPQGVSVARESLYRVAGDGLATMEFSYPIEPAGKEGQIVYHPEFPLQLVTYFLDHGRVVRVDYGYPMRSFDYLLKEAGLQSSSAAADPCPPKPQPEPAPLESAYLDYPVEGDTFLFSAAPAFIETRYAARVIRRPGATSAWATLVRLKRRSDCNVLDRTGTWDFELSPAETKALFDAIADFERHPPEDVVTLDGTQVQLQHHVSGKTVLDLASNDPSKDRLSGLVLQVMSKHVPATDLPSSTDWRTSARQIQNGK
jgi:hypothetical protein